MECGRQHITCLSGRIFLDNAMHYKIKCKNYCRHKAAKLNLKKIYFLLKGLLLNDKWSVAGSLLLVFQEESFLDDALHYKSKRKNYCRHKSAKLNLKQICFLLNGYFLKDKWSALHSG